jgi:AcrR family transcriptional regulator
MPSSAITTVVPAKRRERNKQRTREEIARAAHELFVERGYNATTLPEIAEAAGVSTRTIFTYFPSKEDILFSNIDALTGALAQAIAARPAQEDALETVRRFILHASPSEPNELESRLHGCVSGDPTLRSHLRARIAQLEDVIAPAIAEDLGTTTDDPRTQLVTTSLIAAFNVLADQGATKTKSWTPEEAAAKLEPPSCSSARASTRSGNLLQGASANRSPVSGGQQTRRRASSPTRCTQSGMPDRPAREAPPQGIPESPPEYGQPYRQDTGRPPFFSVRGTRSCTHDSRAVQVAFSSRTSRARAARPTTGCRGVVRPHRIRDVQPRLDRR